jgi:hypothetical protein
VATTKRARSTSSAKKRSTGRKTSRLRRLSLGGHGHDLAGLTLLTLGIVAAFGVYGDLAGPAGRALERATAGAVGRGNVLVPPALVALGCVVLLRRPRDKGGRLVVATVLLTTAVAGLLHLAGGSPSLTAPLADLRSAGGAAGAAVGEPLRAVLAAGGAAVVLLALGGIGVMVLAQADAKELAGAVARAGRAVAHLAAGCARVLVGRLGHPSAGPHDDKGAGTGPASAFDGSDGSATAAGQEASPVVEVDEAARSSATDGEPPSPAEEPPPLVHLPVDSRGPGEQLAIDLGPAASREVWKLPPLTSLRRGTGWGVSPG